MHPRVVIASSAALLTLLTGGAAAATTSLAASPSPGSPSASSTSTPASPTSTPASPTSSSPADASSGAITPLVMKLDAKGAIDRGSLPLPHALFTKAELQTVLSNLTAVTGTDDTISLTLDGEEPDTRSTLVVDLSRFGKKDDITKTWATQKERHRARAAHNPGLYTFFDANEHGVSDSFTDGTTTQVLVTSADAAGIIHFSGIGFGKLRSTHADSRAAFTSTLVPELVELLGAKVKAGAAPAKSTTSPNGSSTPSPTPSSLSSRPGAAQSTSSAPATSSSS